MPGCFGVLFLEKEFDNPSKWQDRALKSAPECPFECGGEGAKAKRAMPKCPRVNLSGASLNGIHCIYLKNVFAADFTDKFITRDAGASKNGTVHSATPI